MSSASTQLRHPYLVVAPNGEKLTLSDELLTALARFMGTGKPAGSVTISFRNGGIAGVKLEETLK